MKTFTLSGTEITVPAVVTGVMRIQEKTVRSGRPVGRRPYADPIEKVADEHS